MRTVFLEAPEALLAERRRLGLDGRDEMWEGVLHVVPPPGGEHQRLGTRLVVALAPLADRLGLVLSYETGLFHADDDYRVPALLLCRPEAQSPRGAEGAELVVEIRSEGDESYAKLEFYAAVGVREVLVVHPDDRRAEVFTSIAGRFRPAAPAHDGSVRSDVLDVALTSDGEHLQLTWDGGAAQV